ncbi:D-sedoheptulose 7-phosphate isomerase [Parelusimicrobium proximum]|uniref:D-sedoheptulose-7-phosphate isomerase n=1 Tax=Parelusimicrobium proximum TaxID=3228953 RepID=UPI003D17AA44
MFLYNEADELIKLLGWVKENLAADVDSLAQAIIECYRKGGKVIIMGNGGSAADAQHMAAEFVGRYKLERGSYPAIALNTNSSTVTAVGNDYSFDQIFSRQVDGFAKAGDVVIGISTSGNSKNVYEALLAAKERNCYTAALLGKDGGIIKDIADLPIVVKSNNTPRVQECHIFIEHSVCDIVDRALKTMETEREGI